MLQQLTDKLNSEGALHGELPPVVKQIMAAIPSPTIPDRMKAVIAVSEIVLYASHFRRNIYHWEGFDLPINSIGIVIAASGEGKDSSVNAARRCFANGYSIIDDKRQKHAKDSAISEAQSAGETEATKWEIYKDYYRAPNPLFAAPSTPEGFIQHLNDLDLEGIGAGFLYSGEIGSELSHSKVIKENIQVIAEIYDLGNKEVKLVKGREHQSKEVKSFPVSALFVGSQANILYQEAIKSIVKIELETKLARRSWFAFCQDTIPKADYTDLDQMWEAEEAEALAAQKAKEAASIQVTTMTNHNITQTGVPITVHEDVQKLFSYYKRYNSDLADTLPKLYPMSALVRRHIQWKVLKLSGAIAIFDGSDIIQKHHFIQAMRFAELLDRDMALFEAELVKEPYEIFVDYIQSIAVDGKASIGLHELRKRKLVATAGDPTRKLKDLAHLAAAYDENATYQIKDSAIHYEEIVNTDILSISFKPIDNSGIFSAISKGLTKDEINKQKSIVASSATYGFEIAETTFPELRDLLQYDYAYSPFKFRDGVRRKENLYGGTKWLVLDIDSSNITNEECHFLLSDINHHIALSSDATNKFKFRVLLELAAPVSLDPIAWRNFFMAVADDLSLTADPVPQSQIFFSYSGREVLSVLDAEPLPVRDYLMLALESSPLTTPKVLTTPQKQSLIADELETFSPAFNARAGEGSRKMIWAARYAYSDLGMPKDDVIDLIYRINDYWAPLSMKEPRLQATIIDQIKRW